MVNIFQVVLLLSVWVITCSAHTGLTVVYAINLGGDAITTTSGINYQAGKDSGLFYTFNVNYKGVDAADLPLYQSLQGSVSPFAITIPITGDGWYGLVIHMAVPASVTQAFAQNVYLNQNLLVLSSFDPVRECGGGNVCNRVIYFSVCRGVITYKGKKSAFTGSSLVLTFQSIYNGVIGFASGVALVKGKAGDGKSIVGTKTVFFFDPLQAPAKCYPFDFK
jgi:Malectin domain